MSNIDSINWKQVEIDIQNQGFAITNPFMSDEECLNFIDNFENENIYRSTIDMKRYNFGKGTYRYFKYPMTDKVQELREKFYKQLVSSANDLSSKLKIEMRYPVTFKGFKKVLEDNGQTKSTPLILRYTKDDYNCLHQDIGSDIIFPYQVVIGLSDLGIDYEGGELILTQQRPRMQTIPYILKIPKGAAVIFSSHFHPVLGKRGYYRSIFKHGVGKITKGNRYTLGLVFHDYMEKV